MMSSVIPKVAVIGSGISGSVCASNLAKNGVSVTVFDRARGPGGRMSKRRETTEDGKALSFDHGAPYFTVTNPGVLEIVLEWESRGLAAEWKEKFGTFDFASKTFTDSEKELSSRRYVGIPGMNSICKALCSETGVDCKFGDGVAKLEWGDENFWSLSSLKGQFLGNFDGVVATDKLLASPGFLDLTGHPPPIDMNVAPKLASRMQEIPFRSCFALMMAFSEPLHSVRNLCTMNRFFCLFELVYLDKYSQTFFPPQKCLMCHSMVLVFLLQFIYGFCVMTSSASLDQLLILHCLGQFGAQVPVKGFTFVNSEILSSAFCDSSKPGRSSASECWVLHSTAEYAKNVIAQSDAGLKKPSDVTLQRVSDDLLQEFQRTGLCTSQPYFLKAHRWGSAFPAASIAADDKCLWDLDKRLVACGDFCVSPNVEGAILSGLAASSKLLEFFSTK